MLKDPIITAFLPTINFARAKQFYISSLGLNLLSEDAFAIELEGEGIVLRITLVNELVPQPFTVLGFKIKEISSQVNSLIKNGVKFERFSGLEQDELGVWLSPSGAKVAWFKDPDGNLLSITE